MPNIETATLTRQIYGIAVAGNTFGSPKGVWLECSKCLESQTIAGSRSEAWLALPDADIAKVFRRHGWSGRGNRMTHARCPKCSTKSKH